MEMALNFDVLLGISERPEQLLGHWTSLVPGSSELFQRVASRELEHQSSQREPWKRRALDTVPQLQKYVEAPCLHRNRMKDVSNLSRGDGRKSHDGGESGRKMPSRTDRKSWQSGPSSVSHAFFHLSRTASIVGFD